MTLADAVFRAVFDRLSRPSAVTDEHGEILAINRAAADGVVDPRDTARRAVALAADAAAGADGATTVEVARGGQTDEAVTLRVTRMPLVDQEPPVLLVEWQEASGDADRARAEFEARLEQVATDAGWYASRVAHDLKGPVTVMRGFAELITPETAPDQVAMLRERILANADHAAEIIEDLVAASRATQQHEPVDLDAALDEAMGATADELAEAEGSVQRPQALPTITGSPSALRQVFTNVLRNAVRFHREGVPPTIVVGLDDAGGPWWHVTVTDNGIGVPADERERVLRPGQRGSNAKDRRGSGLGLAVCRDVLHAMGGAIEVEGRPDRAPGTVIRLTLPRETTGDGAGGSPSRDGAG